MGRHDTDINIIIEPNRTEPSKTKTLLVNDDDDDGTAAAAAVTDIDDDHNRCCFDLFLFTIHVSWMQKWESHKST